jgi:hypothetical protein
MAAAAPQLTVGEQLAHCTVRIETNLGTGTGFFYRMAVDEGGVHIPVIVTNKHVIDGALTGRFLISRAGADGLPDMIHHESYAFQNFSSMWFPHPIHGIDLCAMPIAPILVEAQKRNLSLFYRSLDSSLIPTAKELDELNAIEDITMIGYPNGLWDEVHNMPIFRRGITATHPRLDWNGKPEFLIDAACFPGSSGSPVFLFNQGGYFSRAGLTLGGVRLKLLGILYAGPQHTVTGEIQIVTVPIADKPVALSSIPNNLGIVVRSTALGDLESGLIARLRRDK